MIYEGTIQYISVDKNGNDKIVRERFIIENAQNFTDVETTLYECFGAYTDIEVVAIKRSKITEVIEKREENDDERIFAATLVDVFTDDDGNEKELKYHIAFFAKNIEYAYTQIREYVKQGYNMTLVALKRTNFTDIITV